MQQTQELVGAIGYTPNSEHGAEVHKRRVLRPQVISTQVSLLEQRLLFGRAAKYKMLAAHAVRTQGKASVYKTVAVYAMAVSVLVGAAAWVGTTAFSAPATPMVLSANTELLNELPLTDPAEQELVRAFEFALAEQLPDIVSETTVAGRAALINRYLQEWKSPLAEYSHIIAAQPHWKRVLAISFAESGLGKKCADNNCSGIGVEPGHPKWQVFENKGEWVKAMNRLLERRYKDWTLKEMNGVYNQPGSQNWIAAGNQILNDLKERGIE
jgi:hypothetical protein